MKKGNSRYHPLTVLMFLALTHAGAAFCGWAVGMEQAAAWVKLLSGNF